jgi:hypothetical protein
VELKSGLNVLVFKLTRLHEWLQDGMSWRASVHFTDAAGQPVKGLRVTLTPPSPSEAFQPRMDINKHQ